MVILSLYHELVLGNVNIGINKIDKTIRQVVRKRCDLPHDSPNAFTHASVVDGGLGMPSVRYAELSMRLYRLRSMTNQDGDVDMTGIIQEEIDCSIKRLAVDNQVLDTKKKAKQFWAKSLYGKIDGSALKKSSKVRNQHQWVQ